MTEQKKRINVRDIAFSSVGGEYVTTDGKTIRRTEPRAAPTPKPTPPAGDGSTPPKAAK